MFVSALHIFHYSLTMKWPQKMALEFLVSVFPWFEKHRDIKISWKMVKVHVFVKKFCPNSWFLSKIWSLGNIFLKMEGWKIQINPKVLSKSSLQSSRSLVWVFGFYFWQISQLFCFFTKFWGMIDCPEMFVMILF